MLVKHTGCGMLTFKNDDATGIVKENLGEEAARELAGFKGEFLPFGDLERAVRDDLAFLRRSKLIPDSVVISGWVYEVESGKVKHIA